MANFIGLVYATLKEKGIDTSKLSTDEAVKKFKELNESPENIKRKLNGQPPKQEEEFDTEIIFNKNQTGITPQIYKTTKEVKKFFKDEDVKNILRVGTKNNRLKEKKILEKYQKGIANKDNFFINTIAEWEDTQKPNRPPDYVSKTKTGHISSEYWYEKDGVIRGSGHWGNGVASCDWYLKSQSGDSSKLEITEDYATDDKNFKFGKAKWEDFTQRPKIVKYYGKAVLSNFDNTIDIVKNSSGDYMPIIKNFNEKVLELYK